MSWYERRSYDRRTGRSVAIRHSMASQRRRERIFWNDVSRVYRNTPSMRNQRAIQRRYWYTQMVRRGEQGIRDNRSESNVVLPLSRKNYALWERGLKNKVDLNGIDTPRKDIKEVKIRGLTVWVGGSKQCRDYSQKLLENALKYFTDDELKSIKHLYLERLPNRLESSKGDVGGQTHLDTLSNRKVAKMLYLSPDRSSKEEMMLVHELVHILRKSQNRTSTTTSREEKETELETLARVKPETVRAMIKGKSIGYYDNIPPTLSSKLAISHDRTLMTGGIDKSNKGKELTKDLPQKYGKSVIRKAKI